MKSKENLKLSHSIAQDTFQMLTSHTVNDYDARQPRSG